MKEREGKKITTQKGICSGFGFKKIFKLTRILL